MRVAKHDLMILLLTLAGAGVDAVMLLGFNVLTAAQTGNTILLAVAIAQGHFTIGLSAAVSVVAYVAGVSLGEAFVIRFSKMRGLTDIAMTLVVELIFLVGLLASWHLLGIVASPAGTLALVTLAAVAMGIQSVAVRNFHNGPTTTYVTGVLTSFASGVVQSYLAGRTPPASPDKTSGDSPWKYGLVWGTYTLGAIASGLLFLRVGEMALLLPTAAVAVVIACNPKKF